MTYYSSQKGGTIGTSIVEGHSYAFATATDETYAGMGNTGGGTGFTVREGLSETAGIGHTWGIGKHINITGTITETAGESALASAHISEHDVDFKGGANYGTAVGVGYKAGVNACGVKLSTGDGVSFGPQFAVDASCSCKFTGNKLQISAAGKLAAVVGVHGNFHISIDCGPLEHDAKVVYSHVVHSYDVIGNDVKEGSNFTLTEAAEIMSGDNVAQVLGLDKDADSIAHAVTHQANEVVHDVNSAGDDLKKAWDDIGL